MLTIVLLRIADRGYMAPGRLLGCLDLNKQILQAAGGCVTDLLETPADNTIDRSILKLLDSPVSTWLLGSRATLLDLLPQIDRLAVIDCESGEIELPDDQWLPELANPESLGFKKNSISGSPVGVNCWIRPSNLEVIGGLTAAGDCDLHLHTNCSDGSNTPQQLVDRVLASGLAAFAITDHDNLAALAPARQWLDKRLEESGRQVRFIPGVELSVQEDRELHLLGLFPRGGTEVIEQYLTVQRQTRTTRNQQMIRRLQELGYSISQAEFDAAGDGTIGRLQAALMLRDQGYFPSIDKAFEELLVYGRPAYIERPKPTAAEAIWLIRKAGGVAVLAHPGLYNWCGGQPLVSAKLLERLEILQAAGLQGVEAYHGETPAARQSEISAAGRALGLIRTCGSDDHGSNKASVLLYAKGTHFLPTPEILVVAAMISGPTQGGQPAWLLTRRSTPGSGFGFWELPGGKVETGEPPAAALERELKEELGVKAKIGRRLHVLSYQYPQQRIILITFQAEFKEKTWQLSVHDDARFVTAQEALTMNLLPADVLLFEDLLKSADC